MNKYLLTLLCIFAPLFINAQDNTKYMTGAVPQVDGKVVFSTTITSKNPVSKASLFEIMHKWAEENYKNVNITGLTNRILLSDVDAGDIACAGEKYLVFRKSLLALDQAKMSYQLIMKVEENKCDVTLRNIRYDYTDSKVPVLAEDMITDEVAINKKGDKLNRYYDKFRKATIDTVSSIFTSIDVYLNGIAAISGAVSTQPAIVAQPVQTAQPPLPATTTTPVAVAVETAPASVNNAVSITTLPGYKQVAPDKIPGNYIKLLSDWTLITSGSASQANVMTASWGGLGTLWEKPVSFCFLNPTRYSVQTMDKGEYYTISFYTEAYKDAMRYCGSVSGSTTDKIKGSGLTPITLPSGALAFSEAWMILECKKIVAQPISESAVIDKNVPAQWSKDGYHRMYVGEILNVWIK